APPPNRGPATYLCGPGAYLLAPPPTAAPPPTCPAPAPTYGPATYLRPRHLPTAPPPTCGPATYLRPRHLPVAPPPICSPATYLSGPRRLLSAAPPSRPAAKPPNSRAAQQPSRPSSRAAQEPSRPAAEPPSRRAAQKPSRPAAEPPSRRATQQPSNRAAEPPSSRATEPPSSRAAEPPSCRAAESPCSRTARAAPVRVLAFDAEGRAIDFDVWIDDLQLFLQCNRADGLSLFDLTSCASPAPAADVDATVRSQWATRDAAARLAVRRHLPTSELGRCGVLPLAGDAALARARGAGALEELAGAVETAVEAAEGVGVAVGVVAGVAVSVAAVEAEAAAVAVGAEVAGVAAREEAVAEEVELVAGGAAERVGSGGGQRQQQQQRTRDIPPPQQLWRGVAIFDLDFDAILAAMYAVTISDEGDCYRCFPPNPGIETAALGTGEAAALDASEAAALGASASASSGAGELCALSPSLPFLWGLALPASPVSRGGSGLPLTPPSFLRQRPHCRRFTWTCGARPASVVRVTSATSCWWLTDYSRYTTVFPLRSKGDVTEVLIDWIRAARLQLSQSFGSDFPVLRLHSDRGAEFSSGLLRAYCRARGIRQTFTLPNSPQQNGIAERRIGMIMDVARTSMMHAAAPHFLWPFAVRYAAHLLNLHPRVSRPETSPALLWTGKVGDASAFRVWGSRAFVRDMSADKLSPSAAPCVFLGFPPDAPGWQFYHPTSRRVLSSQDVTFDESVPYYRLFLYHTPSLPPPPLFLVPGPPLVDPLPPQGPSPSGVSQVDAVEPVEVTGDSGAAEGAEPGGAETGGAETRGAETGGAGPGGAEPGGASPGGAEPGGTTFGGAEPGGATTGGAEPEGAGPTCEASGGAGPGGSAAEDVGAAGPGGARTGGTGTAGPAGASGAGVAEGAGAKATAVGPNGSAAGVTGAGGAAGACAAVGGASAVPAVSGVAAQPRPYFVPLLQQVLGLPPSTGLPPPLECPQPVPSQLQLQPASPLPAPSPYTSPSGGLAERREPASRPASPVCPTRASGRSSRERPPPVPGTHRMSLHPSTAPLCSPLPFPPESSLPTLADPESDSLRAASPTVTRLFATVVTDPSFESTTAYALVAELVDFAARCRLDYAESESVCPPSVGGECALGTDVLEERQEEFQCLAAASPHLVSVLLTPEGDPDALDIPTPRSYAEAIEGPDSS
ncbi:unnamed protein product, partial [Closterium sp. NIES-65]